MGKGGFKLQVPPNFGEEPYSISGLVVADTICYLGYEVYSMKESGSGLFLFFTATAAWLSVYVACKLLLKYGFVPPEKKGEAVADAKED